MWYWANISFHPVRYLLARGQAWPEQAAISGKACDMGRGLDICLRIVYITNKLYNHLVKYKNDADDQGHP
jgi:hypothetical protein